MTDEQPTNSWVERQREEMDNISPKMLSYSQRCDLINNTIILCELCQDQQAQLAVMREALESINHMAHNIVRKDGESNEYAVVNRLFEIADICRQALSTTAGADYAKRVAAMERVAKAAKAYVNTVDRFGITRDKLVRILAELEALDNA